MVSLSGIAMGRNYAVTELNIKWGTQLNIAFLLIIYFQIAILQGSHGFNCFKLAIVLKVNENQFEKSASW